MGGVGDAFDDVDFGIGEAVAEEPARGFRREHSGVEVCRFEGSAIYAS